jgi:hypothetical protein
MFLFFCADKPRLYTHADHLFYDFLVDLHCKLAGHYEWHVAFPQLDIDLGAVRARLGKDGDLVIDVPRRRRY